MDLEYTLKGGGKQWTLTKEISNVSSTKLQNFIFILFVNARINNVFFSLLILGWILERDPPSILRVSIASGGEEIGEGHCHRRFGQAYVALVGGRECPVRDPPSSPWAERQYPSCDTLATTLGSVSPGLHRGVNALAWPRLRIDLHSLHCWQPPPRPTLPRRLVTLVDIPALLCLGRGRKKWKREGGVRRFWVFFGMEKLPLHLVRNASSKINFRVFVWRLDTLCLSKKEKSTTLTFG